MSELKSVAADESLKSRSGDKRERILQAAVRVFAKHGFNNARVSDVAKEAGVADGTIYNYFRNKDDLLIRLFEDRMEGIVTAFRSTLDDLPDARDRIRRFVELHLQLSEERPALAEVLTVELRQSARFMRDYKASKFGEYLDVLGDAIELGKQQGTFRDDVDVRTLTRALFGALDETSLVWIRGPQVAGTLVAAAPTLYGIFLDGLCRRDA